MELVEFLAGTGHDIELRDMHDPAVAAAAGAYGIRRVPAVVIDGRLVDYSAGRGLDEETMTRAIFGRSLSHEVPGTGASSDARPRSPISAAVLERKADPGPSRETDGRAGFRVEVALALVLSLGLWAAICFAVASLISNWP